MRQPGPMEIQNCYYVQFLYPRIRWLVWWLLTKVALHKHYNNKGTEHHSCKISIFTCVALAKAGLVVGPLRPSGRPSVRLSVRPSVRPSVCPSVRNTSGCQVCVICNSKTFHSFLFKLCLMIVHILKMCTSYFVHVS